jgi:hypothetical protein
MRNWLNRNGMFTMFLIAVVVTFVINDRESSHRDHVQHDQLVSTCLRASQRTALQAAFQLDASKVRRATGDSVVAERYAAEADRLIETIPGPEGLVEKYKLAEIAFKARNGKLRAHLTPQALYLQRLGCQAANS